jgi:hypothetical protein
MHITTIVYAIICLFISSWGEVISFSCLNFGMSLLSSNKNTNLCILHVIAFFKQEQIKQRKVTHTSFHHFKQKQQQ